jgi:hypothetical protein
LALARFGLHSNVLLRRSMVMELSLPLALGKFGVKRP